MFNQSDRNVVLLKDKAKIFASKGFETYLKNNPEQAEKKHLVIQKTFKKDAIFCKASKDFDKEAYYLVAETSKDLYYIAFILNSSIGKVFLAEDNAKVAYSGTVTTTKLKSFRLIDIPDEYKNPCNELDLVVGTLERTISSGKEYDYLSFVQTFMRDLRDAIAMEIYLKQMFESSNVYVLDSWLSEFTKLHDLEISDWNTYLKSLLESLFSPDNQLLESMKQYRMLINGVFSTNPKL